MLRTGRPIVVYSMCSDENFIKLGMLAKKRNRYSERNMV
jgi:hypothetical protein